uniref:Structural maintenance of chromosomes protein n=1 Tax=Schistocephalus solidus TaxID=70667 RepID=A0A0X3NVR8_SCHSO
MHIRSMVIDGFKSYCQRTEIPGFDVQFNAITGLNGSGKSNILDAICFLLGITNLSQVRATNLQELVYKSGQAGITKATVSIVFDNTDKSTSPYGYEQFDELTITRQIVVGGKNKYLINGTNATNTRVQDLFHSVQLNVNNPHFLIMQGRITKVLNMKPPEILSLLEEAASTKLYETKKEAALKTIEKKDSKLREIDRVLREDITPTIRKLREERSSYLEYQKVVREIEHLTKFTVAYDFTCLEEATQRTKNDLLKLESQVNEEKRRVEQLNEEKAKLEQNLRELAEEHTKLQGPALEEAEAIMSTCQKAEAVASGASSRAAENLKSTHRRLQALRTQFKDLNKQFTDKQLAAEVAAGVEFQELEKAAQQAMEDLTIAQANLEATTSGLSRGQDGASASLAEQARLAEGHRLALETEVRQLEMRERHLGEEVRQAERELAKATGAMKQSESTHDAKRRQLTSRIDQLSKQLNKLKAEDEAAGGDENTMTERYNQVTRTVRDLQAKNDEFARQFNQLTVEYADPQPNFDRRRVLGVVAKLFDLMDLKYATAIEVAAGGKLYNLAVDTEKTGKLLLERGQLRRRITMLPLNQIRGPSIPPEVLDRAQRLVGAQNVASAISLIRFPPHLQPVMDYVFGGLLVCPTLDIARKVAFHPGIERRTVTFDGDVFDPQGTLSGGSRAPAATTLLARLAEWKKVEQALQQAQSQLETARAASQAAAERARQVADLTDQLDAERHQLGILEASMRQSETHRLRSDLERLKSELEDTRKQQALTKKKLEVAIRASEEAQYKANHAQEERDRQLKEAEAAVKEARKRVDRTAAALKEKSTLKETLRLEAEELQKELEQLKENIEQAEAGLETVQKEVETKKAELEAAKAALLDAKTTVKARQKEADEAAKAMQAAEAEAGRLKEKISHANCAVDRFTHELEVQRKESKEAGKRLVQLMEANPWIAEEKQLFGVADGAFDFAKRDPAETRKRVAQLTERRDKLSRTVNMRAMNMLGTAEEQYAELLRRQEIVLADKRKIQDVIDDLDSRKEQVLKAAYEKVNTEFCNIFSSLLPGARAQLVPPEGMTILDGLQFRVAFGEVWKDSLSELSGGQRSLVALALILALLLFKPAPIYILDEVDAALDLSHTQNIGQLIKNHFHHSQFIVVSLKDGMFNNANVLFKTKFVDGVSTVTRHTPSRPGGTPGTRGDSRPHQIGFGGGTRRKVCA